jgi:hypothetical protein
LSYTRKPLPEALLIFFYPFCEGYIFMQVVAFETEIENDVIRIPQEYCGKIHNLVTVTICEFTQIPCFL